MKDFVSGLINRWLPWIKKPEDVVISVENSTLPKNYAATRITTDYPYQRYLGQQRLRAEDALNTAWNLPYIDERQLVCVRTTEMLKQMINTSPDFDRALHDFTQFVVTDPEVVCDNAEGQRIIDEAISTMSLKKESLIAKLEKAAASIFLHGMIFSELILDPAGVNFSDIAIIDALLVEFQPTEDPVDGDVYRLGQMKQGQFVDLHDDPTVYYIAFNAVPGSPFGRSLSASAIFPMVFALMLLKDMRQVIRTQGYPFKYATIDRQVLEDAKLTGQKQEDIIESLKNDLIDFLSKDAGPITDSPVMGSEAEIKMIEGVRGGSLQSVETLITIIERMMVRGLKTYSVIFGINSSTGLSDNSNIQSELHYVLIDSIQRKVEDWMTNLFTEVLRARGNPGIVDFKLKRINTLVNKERSETKKVLTDMFGQWKMNGGINAQEYRDLIRHPDPLSEVDKILKPNLPPDAEQEPNDLIEVESDNEGDSDDG